MSRTELPPARYWDTERRLAVIGGPMLRWGTHYVYSRRKWQTQTGLITGHLVGGDDAEHWRAFIEEHPYRYCDPDAPIARTVLACRILDDIEKMGGEICGAENRELGTFCTTPERKCWRHKPWLNRG